ncbi:MAG: hypothetical protein ACR2LR_00430 [Hassallia sp.]
MAINYHQLNATIRVISYAIALEKLEWRSRGEGDKGDKGES